MTTRKNQVFERSLPPEIFDVAYRIASSNHPFEDQRQLLAVALRDFTTEQEAQDKTKKLLTRVWINPPPEALPLIRWAIANPDQFPDRRVMHLGALLGTFPFVGAVASCLGRAFAIDGAISGPELKNRIVATWGARKTVEYGVIKTAGLLRKFGIVGGGGKTPMCDGSVLDVPGSAASWLIHALVLTRQQQTIDTTTVANAPELFWARLGPTDAAYPHLEIHREGGGRVVFQIKPSVPVGLHKD